MVLQVLPDSRPVNTDRDIELSQVLCRPKSGQHQQLRRFEGSCCEEHLGIAVQEVPRATVDVLDPDGPLMLKQDPVDAGSGNNPKARARSHLAEVRIDRTAAPSAASCKLKVAGAFRRPSVKIRRERQAKCLSGLHEKVAVLADVSRIADHERAIAAVEFVVESLIAFEPAEVRQQRVPVPQITPGGRCPPIVVTSVAAHVHLRVDAAAPAEHPARRDLEFSIVEMPLRDCVVESAVTPFRNEPAVTGTELQIRAAVFLSQLEQDDSRVGLRDQAPRCEAARRSAADDDVIAVRDALRIGRRTGRIGARHAYLLSQVPRRRIFCIHKC